MLSSLVNLYMLALIYIGLAKLKKLTVGLAHLSSVFLSASVQWCLPASCFRTGL